MRDPHQLLTRYLEQQAELGAGALVFEHLPEPISSTPREDHSKSRARPRVADSTAPADGGQAALPDIPARGITIPMPAKDLFTENPLASASLDDIARAVSGCTKCPLHEGRTNGVPGEGPADARLVVVGEGPGKNEDEQGRPFVGRAGKLLDDILAAIACPRETVYIANIVKCRPPANRKPQTDECLACVPYLYRQLEIIAPKVILAMGGTAAETLLNTRASLSSLRNKVHEYRGIPLIVTYHPAALLRNPHWKRPTWDDVRIARQLLER